MGFWDRIGQKVGELVEDLSVPDEVAELYKQAQQAYEAGDYSGAALLAERVTRAEDEHVRAWMLLGMSQLKRDQLVDARSCFERVLTLRSDDTATLAVLAQTQHRLGDDEAAIASCKRALASKVERELLDDFYGLLGEIFLARGDVDRAIRELRKAVAAAGGRDLRLVGLLGRALALDGRDALAAHHLSAAATAPQLDPRVLSALVEVLLREGQTADARLAALRLVEADPRQPAARCLLARAQLEGGQPDQARETLLRALDLDVSQFEAHRLLARAHAAVGGWTLAAEHLRVALERAAPAEQTTLLREHLELLFAALPGADDDAIASHLEELGRTAERLRALEPEDALALAGAAIGARQDADLAMQLAARSLAAAEIPEGRQALALLFEQAGQLDAAVQALRSALRQRPHSAALLRRLRGVYRKRLGLAHRAAEAGLYPTFARVERLLASQRSTAELAPAARRIQQDFDQPLLVAVMGEFNTGKSTFVNALIGEEIAPMGITPTTATINVLKYGAERGARVIWSDDREELLPWEDVGAFLRSLDHERARAVRLVELLEPAEALLRVNVVDTPGLNSIVAEHEQTAREFLEQADAVIWLFSADQAGKETEELALELLQRQRLKTVAVINKVDRLDEAEIERVLAHLRESFSELFEAVLPVSAKRALAARVANDDDALEKSRFPALRGFLEERIFSRSRRIKREAALRKLDELLSNASQLIENDLAPRQRGRARLADLRGELDVAFAGDERFDLERKQLRQSLELVFRRGAEEVLDFVRPRRWRLGTHQAEQADRDFLLEVLLDGLRQVASESRRRVEASLEARTRLLLSGLASEQVSDLERLLAEQRALLAQQVFGSFIAFARGLLSGGRIDEFFARQLPSVELTLEPISKLLSADIPSFESEILDPLRQWDASCQRTLRAAIEGYDADLALEVLELEAAAREPLAQLQRELSQVGEPTLAAADTIG